MIYNTIVFTHCRILLHHNYLSIISSSSKPHRCMTCLTSFNYFSLLLPFTFQFSVIFLTYPYNLCLPSSMVTKIILSTYIISLKALFCTFCFEFLPDLLQKFYFNWLIVSGGPNFLIIKGFREESDNFVLIFHNTVFNITFSLLIIFCVSDMFMLLRDFEKQLWISWITPIEFFLFFYTWSQNELRHRALIACSLFFLSKDDIYLPHTFNFKVHLSFFFFSFSFFLEGRYSMVVVYSLHFIFKQEREREKITHFYCRPMLFLHYKI